jgi:aspartate/glutamate racemase
VAALLEAVQQLASAGAELALLASTSVHIAFDDIRVQQRPSH